MKFLYPFPKVNAYYIILRSAIVLTFLIIMNYTSTAQVGIPELVFTDHSLVSGQDGKDGAVYRFTNIGNGMDALVQINGRSSSDVVLSNIDINYTGYDNAFQPLVNYTGNVVPNCAGKYPATDWYMEFQVSFVQSGTSNLSPLNAFNVTGLDIDGNTNYHEYVSFYNMDSYTLEDPTSLSVTDLIDAGGTLVGKRFDGGTNEFPGIDVTATQAMVTNTYSNASFMIVRVGGKANGPVNISNNGRQYSLWFKSFSYFDAVQKSLPLTLTDFTAKLENPKKVMLNWSTEMEINTSHFVIQRSTDGTSFDDAGILFTTSNSEVKKSYSFADNISGLSAGLVYYRLKIVDLDAKYSYSDIVIVRLADDGQSMGLVVYPNPTSSAIHITLPNSWQNKQVAYSIYGSNGSLIRQKFSGSAGQTETIQVADLPTGQYFIKASSGSQVIVQKFIKAN